MARIGGFRPIAVPPLKSADSQVPSVVGGEAGIPGALASPFALNPARALGQQMRKWQARTLPVGAAPFPSSQEVVHALLSRSEVLGGGDSAQAEAWIAQLLEDYTALGLPPPWGRGS